jgi:hypothetical protein
MTAWVAPVEMWEILSEAWTATLQQPPAIRYFKHHEAKALSGEFDGWDADSANRKILSLANVICANKPLYGITSGLIVNKLRANIEKINIPKRKVRSIGIPTEPYEYCSLNLICRVFQIQLERFTPERVDFVFDDHSLFERLTGMYRLLKADVLNEATKEIAGTLTPGDDREIAALQMADLLAGQMISSLRFGKHEAPLKKLRDNIELLVSPTALPTHMGADELIQLLNVMWSALARIKSGSDSAL